MGIVHRMSIMPAVHLRVIGLARRNGGMGAVIMGYHHRRGLIRMGSGRTIFVTMIFMAMLFMAMIFVMMVLVGRVAGSIGHSLLLSARGSAKGQIYPS
jgi:hypothetical protein